MANPNINTHLPIIVVGTESGNQEPIQNYIETSGQTFLLGTPVSLSSGAVIAWSGTTALNSGGASANLILGIALVQAFNYAVTGGSAPQPPYGPIGSPGGSPTFGTVPNQSNAVNLPHGAAFANGMSIVAQAYEDTIFEAMVDASGSTTFNATNTNIGQQFGLSKDSSNLWYVDLNKTTVGTNTCLTILSLNPFDYASGSNVNGIVNGRVRFRFNPINTSIGG